MTFIINDEIIEKVKDSADIVNVVSDYLPLKKSGANYLGICPFHNEKTPSFTVSETKQIFHCFGCGEGGDAVTFIMKKENLSFPEAVKFLADKLGIKIEETNKNNDKFIEEKNIVYEINKEAARFFYNNLTKNKEALIYLEKRQLNPKVIRQFGLGYSLDSWNSVYTYLINKGYKGEDIEKTGLTGKKSGNNGYYDKFRNRIMFPIIDTKSRVIGFGGRVMDNSMPKYLNSQDTIVFNKGNILYGLNLLSKYSNRKRILLVEGYMDVISLFSSGINYCVASLGTALTEKQARLIKRYGEEVYICYDSDLAGVKAALRASEILIKEDIDPRIIMLPKGKDPDEFIKNNGLNEFEKLFESAFNHVDFKIHINRRKYDLNNAEEKIKFTIEIAKIIKELKSPIEQDVYINKISEEIGVSKDAIEKEIRGKNTNRFTGKNELKQKDNKPIEPGKSVLMPGQIKAEMDLIKLMIYDRDYFEIIKNKISIDDFKIAEFQELYRLIDKSYENKELLKEDEIIEKAMELHNLNPKIIMSVRNSKLNYSSTNVERILTDLINTLLYNNLIAERENIKKRIEELEQKDHKNEDDYTLLKNLAAEFTRLIQEINSFEMSRGGSTIGS